MILRILMRAAHACCFNAGSPQYLGIFLQCMSPKEPGWGLTGVQTAAVNMWVRAVAWLLPGSVSIP